MNLHFLYEALHFNYILRNKVLNIFSIPLDSDYRVLKNSVISITVSDLRTISCFILKM